MEPSVRSKLNTQIYEEASAWFVEARAGDLDDVGRREFDRWLRKSPEHVSAYLEVAAIWNEGPALDPTRKWNTDTLIAQAARDPGNVIAFAEVSSGKIAALPTQDDRQPKLELDREAFPALDPTGEGGGGPPSPRNAADIGLSDSETAIAAPTPWRHERTTSGSHRKRRTLGLAAAIALMAASGALWWTTERNVYTTAIGEQRSLEFADGSTVEMNSRSKIRVRYSEHERAVDLLEGQALFHVAKDHARPFIVSADGTRVRAVGTQFDVYEKRSGTVVTVLEGEVAVLAPLKADARRPAEGSAAPRDTPAYAISLSAGEQLTVTPKFARKSEHPNVAAATAWTERRIVFESATLSEVAEEFNRYNERKLVIEDPGLYDFHLSGVFSSTDPESLIRFLRERPGVRITETDSEVRVARSS